MADGSNRYPNQWASNEIEILRTLYPQRGTKSVRDALPWRTLDAINAKAREIGLRSPLGRARKHGEDAFDRELTPREQVRVILGFAGAPMTPAAVADRMPLERWLVASLLSDMAEDGEIITASVAGRSGLITLAVMPKDEPVEVKPKPADKPRKVRTAFTGRFKRGEGEARKQIIALMRERPRMLHELAEAVGLATSSTRDHLRELKEEGAVKIEGKAKIPGSKYPRPLFALTEDAR